MRGAWRAWVSTRGTSSPRSRIEPRFTNELARKLGPTAVRMPTVGYARGSFRSLSDRPLLARLPRRSHGAACARPGGRERARREHALRKDGDGGGARFAESARAVLRTSPLVGLEDPRRRLRDARPEDDRRERRGGLSQDRVVPDQQQRSARHDAEAEVARLQRIVPARR